MIENFLLSELICPIGKYDLRHEGDYLICTNCGIKFPIVDNIPVLLIDEAVLPEGISSHEELKCAKQ